MEKLRQIRYFTAVGGMVFVLFWVQPGFGNTLDSKKYSRIIWNYLETLCAFGPRNPDSEGYRETLDLIRKVGGKYADQVVEHPFFVSTNSQGKRQAMVNLELRFQGTQGGAPILIGAHFDTRPFADEDPDPANRSKPILGANDGGSGTAVLLGLAQYLSQHPVARPVHLVFFDGEDFGAKDSGLNLLGSTYYAQQLAKQEKAKWPHWVLVIDMVGDKDLQIFKETHSLEGGADFLDKIYRVARDQGVSALKEKTKYTIYDDHYPFHQMGIPSTVLIDFDYPHWHTLQDTLDKCSIESMFSIFSVVVKTLEDI
ncbi:MAG: M28 family peptidase [Nitrospina sp.]|jgi:glutaminyl-peptide cyclotransferase|nr:M28 family peptidase [Nitrospina sp.]MBT3414131.1 M28 family peptidase [Nitrospina sp.]MBT3857929.1 M28 family peptidase [Nitrospina sp.]MBT4103657.1 M28 family peptidase [Nitrospina sp.]MBT4389837.1 M28 family peptidase [Nitrospina sp.]